MHRMTDIQHSQISHMFSGFTGDVKQRQTQTKSLSSYMGQDLVEKGQRQRAGALIRILE